jgi:hypothetical protein
VSVCTQWRKVEEDKEQPAFAEQLWGFGTFGPVSGRSLLLLCTCAMSTDHDDREARDKRQSKSTCLTIRCLPASCSARASSADQC